MARETIGEIRCPYHRRRHKADVRRDKNGKLYFYCSHCGPVIAHGRTFQEWVLENARLYGVQEQVA